MKKIKIFHNSIVLPPTGKENEKQYILKVLERFQEDDNLDLLLNKANPIFILLYLLFISLSRVIDFKIFNRFISELKQVFNQKIIKIH